MRYLVYKVYLLRDIIACSTTSQVKIWKIPP